MNAMIIIPLTTGRDLHAFHDGLESTHRALGQRHGAEARDRGDRRVKSMGGIHGSLESRTAWVKSSKLREFVLFFWWGRFEKLFFGGQNMGKHRKTL